MTTAITFPGEPEFRKFQNLRVSVVSPETQLEASNHLTAVRLATKHLTADIAALKRPHQDEIKAIDEAAKPWKQKLAEVDQALERALLDYGRKVREAAEVEQRKQLEKYEKKVAVTEAKAVAQGKPIPVVLPPPIIATPPKTVQTDGAKQTVVKRKAWRVRINGLIVDDPTSVMASTNIECKMNIPLDFFMLDTARIGKVVRAGGTVPGIEVYDEESIAVRAE